MKKKCFKCERVKSLDDYYKHAKMADGHLNKCKQCTRKDVKEREENLRKDPEWCNIERARQREKYKRLNYKEKQKEWDKDKPWKQSSKYKNLSRKFKTPKGVELHHWSYKDKDIENVFFLSRDFHKFLHKFLILDLDNRCFFDIDGNILDTWEKHKNYIKKISNKFDCELK